MHRPQARTVPRALTSEVLAGTTSLSDALQKVKEAEQFEEILLGRRAFS
jgi:hypothetical protein